MNIKANEIINDKLLKGENVLVMIVGDSITYGCDHCSTEETFCAYLARFFAKKYPQVSILRYDGVMVKEAEPHVRYGDPIIVNKGSQQTLTFVKSGVGGNTVKHAIARSQDYVGVFENGEFPDLFLLMFGINDSVPVPEKYASPEEFYDDYKRLYNLIKENNSNADIVFMTPTYNDCGDSAVSSLDLYSDMVKKLAEENGSQVIDTHKFWMDHLIVGSENYGQRDWLSGKEGDLCHMSHNGNRATAEFIFGEL